MKRVFWLTAGLGAGVTAAYLVARWTKQQRQRLSPANLGRQAGQTVKDAGSLLSEMVREFRAGMTDKETEIRSSLPG